VKPLLSLQDKNFVSRILVRRGMAGLESLLGNRETLIIIDRCVYRLWNGILPAGKVLVMKGGEAIKSVSRVTALHRRLIRRGVDRSALLVAVGGGTLTDLCGYSASTYLRGIPFGFVPTTLLAAADAAVGGKTGINLQGYKNVIGTFTLPEFVYINLDFFRTLPRREIRNGFSEIIKHALIGDPGLFYLLENTARLPDPLSDLSRFEDILIRSLQVKIDIVRKDQREQGPRRVLNLGHTVAHALEKRYRIGHGTAVAAGLTATARLSMRYGYLRRETGIRILTLLDEIFEGITRKYSIRGLGNILRQDKKRYGEDLHMVLLEDIGRVIVRRIPLTELQEALDDIC
jgi:3-dehydroquinate synthase